MTLDNPALAGRRHPSLYRRSMYERRAVLPARARVISDVRPAPSDPAPKPAPRSASAKATDIVFASRRTATARRMHQPRTSHTEVLKRQVVHKAAYKKVRRKVSIKGVALTALSVVLFAFGTGVGIAGLRTNHKVAAQVRQLAQQSTNSDATAATTDVPSESKPKAPPTVYRTAPDLPRLLSIPKLGVQARVLRTSVNAKNELGTPSNIFDTAWYDGSAKPGEPGAVLIDGHVSGPTQNGVFYNLKKLVRGDKITLERGDGKVFTYAVVTSKAYDARSVDMAAALTSATPGKPGLNLITCTGKIDSSGTHYQQRLVVFAVQE